MYNNDSFKRPDFYVDGNKISITVFPGLPESIDSDNVNVKFHLRNQEEKDNLVARFKLSNLHLSTAALPKTPTFKEAAEQEPIKVGDWVRFYDRYARDHKIVIGKVEYIQYPGPDTVVLVTDAGEVNVANVMERRR